MSEGYSQLAASTAPAQTMTGLQAGQDYVTNLFNAATKTAAGKQAAQGQYGAAAQTLASRPDLLPQAEQMQGQQSHAAKLQALTLASGGDVQGAREAAAGTGDADFQGKAGDAAHQELADKLSWIQRATSMIKSIGVQPGDMQGDPNTERARAIAHLGPALMQWSGGTIGPREMQQILSSPHDDASLDHFITTITQPFSGVLKPGETAFVNGQQAGQGYVAPVTAAPGTDVVSGTTGAPLHHTPQPLAPVVHPAGSGVDAFNPNPDTPTPSAAGVGTVQPSGAAGGAGRGAASIAANPQAAFSQIAGGNVTITSAARDPAHNAAVGGVPNSEHIPGNGQAWDIVPPPGMTTAQLAAKINAAGIGAHQVLDEGNHVHVGFAAAGSSAPQSQDPHLKTLIPAGGYSAPHNVMGPDGRPLPGQYITGPDGKPEQIAGTAYGAGEVTTLRKSIMEDPSYVQARAGIAAYQAMVGNAKAMNGPSGYAMLDTFARAINPGAVARRGTIEAISESLGVPAQTVGQWYNLIGQGKLTPQVRQQIIDAVYPFVQSHWKQANDLIQNTQGLAQRHGANPQDVTVPLEAMPAHVRVENDSGGGQRLSPEQAAQLAPGTHFVGMDGKPRVRK